MFKYSERPQTYAARKLEDDVPEDVKQRRLEEIIELQNEHATQSNEAEIGAVHTVLVEGTSKKSDEQLFGRTDTNKGVVFDREDYEQGDYVKVRIDDCTSSTLLGTAIEQTTLEEAARTNSITTEPAVA
jgi:tRNA-2-methylthio-N6-dimethylallyladenosine synthase